MITSHKGIMAETLIPAILIIIVIVVSIVAFTGGKIPRTFAELQNMTQSTVNLWNKVTGADDEKLLEEKQAKFAQSYLSLVETYRTCSLRQQENCFCALPDVEHLTFEDHSISVEQFDEQRILFRPFTVVEGNVIALPPGPQAVPGKLCVLRDAYSDPKHGYILDYPVSLRLQFNDEHLVDFAEVLYSTSKSPLEPILFGLLGDSPQQFTHQFQLGNNLYKFHSLEHNASVVCFGNVVYANQISPSRLCSS